MESAGTWPRGRHCATSLRPDNLPVAFQKEIEQISGDVLAVNQGTLYPVLLKLEQEGAIASEWADPDRQSTHVFTHTASHIGRALARMKVHQGKRVLFDPLKEICGSSRIQILEYWTKSLGSVARSTESIGVERICSCDRTHSHQAFFIGVLSNGGEGGIRTPGKAFGPTTV